MSGPGITGPGTGRGGVLGRLLGAGTQLPAGAVAAVGGREIGWAYGECAFVVMVGGTGPARVHYALTEPAGPTWLRLVEVSERRRRRVLSAVLRSGALEGAGPRGTRAGLGTGEGSGFGTGPGSGFGTGGGAVEGASPFGWFHAAAGDRSVWTDLPSDGRISGVAVRDLVVGLVPGWVWEELHARRDEAWNAWARRCGSVPDLDRTRRDSGDCGGGFDPDATRRQAVDQGPWDTPVAGARRPGEGWPGIRHGGGMGGAW